ncbi:GAP family protein [Rathayibacter soli]|uniref:GAP family protein n=1 Tax=Rathayibacter soli TaxID=3144168 RepID=UPI0027E5203C|nr:GAP family protein [Glaciibacter superstes]
MNEVIGAVLPSALAIALSPVPIIAVIVMLRSPDGKGKSVAFLIGWLLGILIGVVAFTALESIIPATSPAAAPVIFGVIAVVIGVALVLLAAGQLRTRPGEGEEAGLPGWLNAIDSLTVAHAGIFGLVFAVAKPKNLLLLISGGLIMGAAGLEFWQLAISTSVFVIVAASSVLIPVIAYLIAASKLDGPLENLHEWLVAHNSALIASVMFIVGIVLIGAGISAF